jgi:hypothetical protein
MAGTCPEKTCDTTNYSRRFPRHGDQSFEVFFSLAGVLVACCRQLTEAKVFCLSNYFSGVDRLRGFFSSNRRYYRARSILSIVMDWAIWSIVFDLCGPRLVQLGLL